MRYSRGGGEIAYRAGTVSVDYATRNDTAIAGVDYIKVLRGQLFF